MIKDLQKILKQVHEPNELSLVAHNLNHPIWWIFKAENAKLKDLDIKLRPLRKEHSRFDIFINGQIILEKDYFLVQCGKDLHVNLLKGKLPFSL